MTVPRDETDAEPEMRLMVSVAEMEADFRRTGELAPMYARELFRRIDILQSQLTETRDQLERAQREIERQREVLSKMDDELSLSLDDRLSLTDQLEKAKAALEQERAIKTALLDSGRRETDG